MSTEEGDIPDEELEDALAKLEAENPDGAEMAKLFEMLHENRIMSWEETERAIQDADPNQVVKSGLKQTTRPSEPDNETNIDEAISRLQANDPKLTELNLNNMKRTPIPQLHRVFAAVRDNAVLKKLHLANLGLGDNAAEPLINMIEGNKALEILNLETNYLSGEFLAKLFEATMQQQTLREIKCVNQSAVFSTMAEKKMLDVIQKNKALTKVSVQMRMPEARQKIDSAVLRNGEIRRVERREAAAKAEAKKRAGMAPMISRPSQDTGE